MGRWRLAAWLLAGVVGLGGAAPSVEAQAIAIPNASFEQGDRAPAGWTLSGGAGEWRAGDAADGSRSIAVTGDGQGSNEWRSGPLALGADAVYRVRFRGRSLGGHGGTPVSGPPFCNRDLGDLAGDWHTYTSIFATPHELTPDLACLRFGQWCVQGAVAFDQIELARVQPLYVTDGEWVLGDGESVTGKTYRFEAPFESESRNQSRPLLRYRGIFNTNRWCLGAGDEVVYQHDAGHRRQTAATIEVGVTWHAAGELAVEVGGEVGTTWEPVGVLTGVAHQTFPVPAKFLPAGVVRVRLRARAAKDAKAGPCSLQVGAYAYEAKLTGRAVEILGSTRYLVLEEADPHLDVEVVSLGSAGPDRWNTALVRLTNLSSEPIRLHPAIRWLAGGKQGEGVKDPMNADRGSIFLMVRYPAPPVGLAQLGLTLGEGVHFRATLEVVTPEYYDTSYGERLPSPSDLVNLWWASSGWKIPRDRPLPAASGAAVRIAAARNETEAAQVVVSPRVKLSGLRVQSSALVGPGGATIPAERIEILRERYLSIRRPTDATGVAAVWPDPLLPLAGPIDVEAGNQPLWVRVNIPKGIPTGTYVGSLALAADGQQHRGERVAGTYAADVPLQVEVFDFDLPDRMTCSTAFGFDPGQVWRYQGLTDPAARRAVLERYWASFAAHHISPYDPTPLDPFEVKWVPAQGKEAGGAPRPVFAWEAWDRAMTAAMERYHFNSFILMIPGLGGGTYAYRVPPRLLEFGEETPQYREMFRAYCHEVQEHLRARGWLDRAYVYWFDEPERADYPFVMNGMRKLKEAAPDLRRMLTEQVEPGLVGGPNLWCPVTASYDHAAAEVRRRAGEQIWWYVCTGPKAPFCTLFIDHPATDLRVWLWQTWQRGIDGILVWQSNYWTSSAAYPEAEHPQDPYADPMSWTSGYGTPAGTHAPWGNGDGRFLYPPESAADGHPVAPVLAGPVESLRWEMLRDGIEDYEYLALLKRLLAAKGAGLGEAERARYAALLEVPASITRDLTTSTHDPGPIEARRVEVARAIEELQHR